MLVSARRDANAARQFFQRALTTLKVTPTEVVTDAAAVHPAGAVLVEAHDEWQTGDRRYPAEGSMNLLSTPTAGPATTELVAA